MQEKVEKKNPRFNELDIKIMGGSLGAKFIIKLFPRFSVSYQKIFQILNLFLSHQCGRGKFRRNKNHITTLVKQALI